MRPTFIGIGGHKAASTWAFMVLHEHPEICMTDVKETHYFSSNFERGEEWYLDRFRSCRKQRVVGEFSTTYYGHPEAAARIHAFAPDIKLLMTVRDPVERTISQYRFVRQLGLTDLPFGEAIGEHRELTAWSLYGTCLRPFLERFDRRKFHFVRKDDIDADPRAVVRDLYAFLEVDPEFDCPLTGRTIGRSINPRSRWLETARDRIFTLVHDRGLERLVPLIRKTGLPALYRRLNDKPETAPVATAEQKAMLRERYADDMRLFQDLTGVDVSPWLPEAHNNE